MLGVGGNEFLLVGLIAILLFGPDKLPQFARTVGRFMRDFKRYQAMMESTIKAEFIAAEMEDKERDTLQKMAASRKATEDRAAKQAGAEAEDESDDESHESGDGADSGDTSSDSGEAAGKADENEPESDGD